MNHLGVGGWLVLAALALSTKAPLEAQEPTGDQPLTDRFQQIQGQAAPPAAQPSQEPARAGEPNGAPSEARATERPALSADEVRTLLAEGLGVDVLRIEAIESAQGPAYAVTVMNPPGNDDSAFLVETLLVDGATGGLLGQVPQAPRAAAPGVAVSTRRAIPDDTGLEIRRRTYR